MIIIGKKHTEMKGIVCSACGNDEWQAEVDTDWDGEGREFIFPCVCSECGVGYDRRVDVRPGADGEFQEYGS